MKQKTTKKAPVWFTLLIAALIIYGGYKFFSSDSGPKDHKSMAYIISQDYVKQKLTYPDESDFPTMPVSTTLNKDSVYNVIADVTTKNGFGVKIDVHYQCLLKFTGGNDADNANWRLVELRMK